MHLGNADIHNFERDAGFSMEYPLPHPDLSPTAVENQLTGGDYDVALRISSGVEQAIKAVAASSGMRQSWGPMEGVSYALSVLTALKMEIDARLWQEEGTRLFEEWRSGELPDLEAATRFQDFWGTYSPDDYFDACQTSPEEVANLLARAAGNHPALQPALHAPWADAQQRAEERQN